VAVAVGAGSRRNMFKAAALAIACGAAVPVAVVAWLAARGALGDAIDEVVFYNFAYRGSSPGFDYAVPAAGLILAGLAVPVAALAASMIRRRKEFDRTLWVCLAWVVALVIMIGYENRLFLHYLILAVPALVMLWGPGVGRLIAHFGSADRRTRYLAVAGASSTAALGVVSAFAIIGLTGVTMSAAWQAEAVTSATAGWLDANTPASATVFVWGNDTGLFLASGRSPYDRYIYQYPLVTFGYASPEKTAAILRAWTASPPTVVVEAPANVPMFDQPSAHAAPFDDDTLAPLRDFVRGHYHLVATFGSGGDVEHVYLSVGSS